MNPLLIFVMLIVLLFTVAHCDIDHATRTEADSRQSERHR